MNHTLFQFRQELAQSANHSVRTQQKYYIVEKSHWAAKKTYEVSTYHNHRTKLLGPSIKDVRKRGVKKRDMREGSSKNKGRPHLDQN